MAAEDVPSSPAPLAARPPPPLQPRTRSPAPKTLDALKSSEARQPSPLSHQPVRPAIARTPSAIAYGQTMYGVGVSEASALAPPRAKPEIDKEELTTKGRKRKRLAKACSACHKNKRRCDGFAPCSNCEFSARPCIYLNAQGEQIPPPRTRDSSAAPITKPGEPEKPPAAYAPVNGSSSPEWRHSLSADPRWRGPLGPMDLVERDPALQAELLDIALRRTPAYACMFHVPTFYHRLYLNRVQPFLLDALYSLGARLCEHPAFVQSFAPDLPSHKRGRLFAERCRANLDRVIEVRARWSDEERKMDQGTWEETEFVQSCIIMSVFYNSNREARVGFYYLDVAIAAIRPASGVNGSLAPPNPRLNLGGAEFFTLAEVRNRTLWIAVLQDICAVASGHPRRVSDAELANIPLPGPEIYWARYGGMASNGREPRRRDTIAVGTGNWPSEEGQVGELGHIVRILIIFANIMGFVNTPSSSSSYPHGVGTQFEQALKAWATDLPRSLRFDEVNLTLSMGKIKSPIPAVAFSGWAFAYIHAVAECGMFYLQSKHAGSPTAVQRQGQAVDNLTVMIDALGERGREGPLTFFPIMIITCWLDHLQATSPSATQALLEDRLIVWWAELYREWGWERRETLEKGIFPNLEGSPTRSPQPTTRPRSRLEHQQPPVLSTRERERDRPAESISSVSGASAASQNVVTPGEQTSGYSRYPILPPLGRAHPRARSPSPLRRSQGSVGSAGSLERDREREREREREPLRSPHAERERERRDSLHRSPHLDSPRRDPVREALASPHLSGHAGLHHLDSPNSNGGIMAKPHRSPHLPSPPREHDLPFNQGQGQPGRINLPPLSSFRPPRDFEVSRDMSREGSREPRPLAPPVKRWPSGSALLGIEALVSAAEEHRRESLEQPSAVA